MCQNDADFFDLQKHAADFLFVLFCFTHFDSHGKCEYVMISVTVSVKPAG